MPARLSEVEEKSRLDALEAHDYNVSQAARALNVRIATLQGWWRTHQLRMSGWKRPKSRTRTVSGIQILRASLKSCSHMLGDPTFKEVSPLVDRRLRAIRAELDYALSLVTPALGLVTPGEPEKVVPITERK